MVPRQHPVEHGTVESIVGNLRWIRLMSTGAEKGAANLAELEIRFSF